MFRSLAALCLVAAPLLTAFAADEPVATEFVSKEGKFKATFPTKPETTEAKPKGGFAVTTTTAIPKPGQVFTVTYFDLPIDIPADKAKETLVALAGGIKGKTLSDKEVAVGKDKLPGRDAVYELPNAHIRQLMILDGKRIYQVIVGGPTKEDVTSKAADKFVDSFQVTK